MPADDATSASQVAEECANSVRRLAEISDAADGSPGLAFPADVYLALGFLARAQRELPAALQHLSAWLLAETVAGRVAEGRDGPYGGDVRAAVEAAAEAIEAAAGACGQAADAVTRAQLALRAVQQA